MPYLQELIHKFEVGPWFRHGRTGLAILAVVGLVVGYNWRSFRNFNTQEAMDSAQLARNLAQGRGYTTMFVRPLSMHLLKQRALAQAGAGQTGAGTDPAQLKGPHPDLANPPVYPCVLAAAMKILPMKWQIDLTKSFWNRDGKFYRYQPDFMIGLINEMIFFAVIVLTFLLARKLFDPGVAWLAGLLLLGSELLWRFSVSGLSTLLLMLIFVGLLWFMVLLEQEVREPRDRAHRLFLFAGLAGLMLGLGMLTRYAFGWLIIPVLVYLILFAGPRKALVCLLTLAVFLAVVTPWLYRNVKLSGMPFGTASYAILEGTVMFPEHKLARTLDPDFSQIFWSGFLPKLFNNLRLLLATDLPKLGGSWLTGLFLAGLLLGFRNPAIRRLRYFAMMCLGTLALAQALGRTTLSEDSPELNSENLLVLLVPVVFVYGVSLFFLMLDQMNLIFGALRFLVVGLFGLIMVLPMLLTFLPPRPNPVNFPPYHPYIIQHVSGFMNEHELMMSDAPWAVAWYGQRQCVWLTLDVGDEFFAINDMIKPVRGLYISPLTMDAPFLTQWIRPGPKSWSHFMLECLVRYGAFPASFPLREALPGLLPDQMFLTDRKRWSDTSGVLPATPPTKPADTK